MQTRRRLASLTYWAISLAGPAWGCTLSQPLEPITGGGAAGAAHAATGAADAGRSGSDSSGATPSATGGSATGGAPTGAGGSVASGAGGEGAGASTGSGGAIQLPDAGRDASVGKGGAASGGDGQAAGQGGRVEASAERGGAGGAGRTGHAGSAGTDSAGAAGSAQVPTVVPRFVGNITFREQADVEGLTFSQYWDQITPEHAGTWGAVQSRAGAAFKWSALDAIYDYAEQSGIVFQQHSFVWGSQQPSGDITSADVQAWMRAFCERYPHTKLIEVVNEPPPHTKPMYADAIGGGTDGSWQWIANAFLWARAACPNAVLLLNDYNIIEYSEDNARIIAIVQAIQALGAPIDAVGAQGFDVAALPIASVKSFMDNIHDQTGLPLYITAYQVDDPDDDGQLQTYQAQFPVFLDTEYVRGITLWGWVYDAVWVDNYESYLVKDGVSRPAMTWLMQQLGRPAP
jgi:endo-1,4-beta-xylanase